MGKMTVNRKILSIISCFYGIRFWLIMGFFAINALLNVLWTHLFFYNHLIGTAVLEAVLLRTIWIIN